MRAKAIIYILLVFALMLVTARNADGTTQKVLYSFTGGVDGGDPYAGVILDSAGNLYGVTEHGGLYGRGTVFKLAPSQNGWTETVLYNFTGGTDGAEPIGGLTWSEYGELYGTASAGGDPASGCGTVFNLWNTSLTVVHTFKGSGDGCSPGAVLYYISGGGIWGTTVYGGSRGYGAAFVIDSDGNYAVDSFSGSNGQNPWGGINQWGYGVTFEGGRTTHGKLYQVIWPSSFKIIRGFGTTSTVGYHPMGELLAVTINGVRTMYGVTYSGAAGGGGAVYRMTEDPVKQHWATKVLHAFSGPDGEGPGSGVIRDAAGNIYGTTMYGGADPGFAGTVFKLSPGLKNKWVHTVLYNFSGGNDGGVVTSGVVMDAAGNLYGTTSEGGLYGQGVVYQIVP